MTDDEIRGAILKAQGFKPFSVSNHVVVDRDRVAGDRDEVDRWVIETAGGSIPPKTPNLAFLGNFDRHPAARLRCRVSLLKAQAAVRDGGGRRSGLRRRTGFGGGGRRLGRRWPRRFAGLP